MSAPAAPERPGWLDQLPAFDPPEHLWSNVLARREAQMRRQRLFLAAAAAGLAAALVLGYRLAVPTDAPPRVVAGTHSPSALAERIGAQTEAMLLEQAVQAARANAGAAPPGARDVEFELARVDGALQSAYDRRAGNEELGRLWRARGELEAALLAAYQRPTDLVRL